MTETTGAGGDRRRGSTLALYEWNAWELFLAPALFPEAHRVEGRWDDGAGAVLAALPPEVEHLLFQVNLSVTERFPKERAELVEGALARGIRVWNRGFADIRKSALQALLLRIGLPSVCAAEEGPADELLIVKTDYNFGAKYEQRLEGAALEHLRPHATDRLFAKWDRYQVLPRREIPDEWWSMPSLAIERFIANPRDEFFRAYVLGDRLVLVKAYDERQIKKVTPDPRNRNFLCNSEDLAGGRAELDLPPGFLATVDRFLAATGLDFGCIDVVHDEREFFIVDLNTTPFGGPDPPDHVLDHLRAGLDGLRR